MERPTPGPSGMPCANCQNRSGNQLWRAREIMFGTRDGFEYLECGRCGSLRIVAEPTDLGRYYPDDYHSLQTHDESSRLKAWLIRRWADQSFGERNLVGAVLRRFRGDKVEASWILPTGLPRSARILDVGSGGGAVLAKLRQCGFTDLTGVDPFIPADMARDPGFRIRKGEIGDIRGEFDLVMFHHSLEHIRDQRRALERARELVGRRGWVLVRVPVLNEGWRRYGTDWVELDAPRHLALHTPLGVERLAAEAGLELEHVAYDSSAFELWASEQYTREIPLFDERSHQESPRLSPFSRRQIRGFRKTIERWNEEGLSGRAAFYFRAGSDEPQRVRAIARTSRSSLPRK